MRALRLGVVAIATAASLASAPANAASFLVSFSGYVASGQSLPNLFGVGQDLVGQDFDLSFSFEFPSSEVTLEKLAGFPGSRVHATESNVLLTIGGTTVSLGSNDVDYLRLIAASDHRLQIGSEYLNTSRSGTITSKAMVSMRSSDVAFFNNVNPFAALDYTIQTGRDAPGTVTGFGSFSIVDAPLGGKVSTRAEGVLDVRRVRVSEVLAPPAVPEPATWAMMIAGFGIAGALLRARRRGEPALA